MEETEDVTVESVSDDAPPAPISIKRETKVRIVIYGHEKCGGLSYVLIFVGEDSPRYINCWRCRDGYGVPLEKMYSDGIGMRAMQIDNWEEETVYATISKEGIVVEQPPGKHSDAQQRVHAQGRESSPRSFTGPTTRLLTGSTRSGGKNG